PPPVEPPPPVPGCAADAEPPPPPPPCEEQPATAIAIAPRIQRSPRMTASVAPAPRVSTLSRDRLGTAAPRGAGRPATDEKREGERNVSCFGSSCSNRGTPSVVEWRHVAIALGDARPLLARPPPRPHRARLPRERARRAARARRARARAGGAAARGALAR